jgi:hypothetical protein
MALEAAVQEYEELGTKRREIDERLAQLAQTIGTLNRLCGYVATVPWGLTDACRVVLRGAGRAMTPTEIRDRLAAIGFDLTKYANTLAAIHTVLKRLNESKEVIFVELEDGKFACELRPALRSFAIGGGQTKPYWGKGLDPANVKKSEKRRKK